MIVKRVGPLSVAKIAGLLYALMGLLLGALFSLISVAGFAAGGAKEGLPGMLFGVGAIIVLPIFYGVLGFVFTLIGAAIYNLIAGWVGGVELEVQ